MLTDVWNKSAVMKLQTIAILALCLVCFVACHDDEDFTSPAPNFITSDIDLFWKAFDNSANPASINFEKLYINQGTDGLRDYAKQKDLAAALKSTLGYKSYLNYYDAIRTNTLDVSATIDNSKRAFLALEEIYPDTKFFNVYFLVGAMTAGGRVSDNGLLIAVEMFCKNDDTPLSNLSEWHQNVLRNKEYLSSIVVHEFVHMQQNFQPANSDFRTALEQSIVEGMADFIAFHLLENQPFMNEHLHAYGDPIEAQIWAEFENQKNMNYQDTEWLYTGNTTSKGHPADMGYYVGFKILEAYSSTFDTVEEAIATMLAESNYAEILEQCGYAKKFD